MTNHLKAKETFYVEGSKTMTGKVFQIDTKETYTIEGWFRSVPYPNEPKSILYFGLNCMRLINGNVQRITESEVLRKGTECTIVSMDLSKRLITVGNGNSLKTWKVPKKTQNQMRYLGFYFDGNISKLPDYILSVGSSSKSDLGGFCDIKGKEITLGGDLPNNIKQQIVLGKTKVMNHHSGGTYSYYAASYATVPYEWTKYTATITGEGWGNNKEKFRIGTTKAQLLVLANYSQDIKAKLLMRDFKVSKRVDLI